MTRMVKLGCQDFLPIFFLLSVCVSCFESCADPKCCLYIHIHIYIYPAVCFCFCCPEDLVNGEKKEGGTFGIRNVICRKSHKLIMKITDMYGVYWCILYISDALSCNYNF